jgi:hypothetical protein
MIACHTQWPQPQASEEIQTTNFLLIVIIVILLGGGSALVTGFWWILGIAVAIGCVVLVFSIFGALLKTTINGASSAYSFVSDVSVIIYRRPKASALWLLRAVGKLAVFPYFTALYLWGEFRNAKTTAEKITSIVLYPCYFVAMVILWLLFMYVPVAILIDVLEAQ